MVRQATVEVQHRLNEPVPLVDLERLGVPLDRDLVLARIEGLLARVLELTEVADAAGKVPAGEVIAGQRVCSPERAFCRRFDKVTSGTGIAAVCQTSE